MSSDEGYRPRSPDFSQFGPTEPENGAAAAQPPPGQAPLRLQTGPGSSSAYQYSPAASSYGHHTPVFSNNPHHQYPTANPPLSARSEYSSYNPSSSSRYLPPTPQRQQSFSHQVAASPHAAQQPASSFSSPAAAAPRPHGRLAYPSAAYHPSYPAPQPVFNHHQQLQHDQAQFPTSPYAQRYPQPQPPPPTPHTAHPDAHGGAAHPPQPLQPQTQTQTQTQPASAPAQAPSAHDGPASPEMPPRRAAAQASSSSSASASASAPVEPSPVRTKFPTARIKRIMQADEEVGKVAQQTPIAVGKALELFMIQLVRKSADVAKDKGQKRVSAQMLKHVVETDEQWDFLRDIVSRVEAEERAPKAGRARPESDSEAEEPPEPKRKGRGGRKKKL